jgi:hypothetical protein
MKWESIVLTVQRLRSGRAVIDETVKVTRSILVIILPAAHFPANSRPAGLVQLIRNLRVCFLWLLLQS